MDLAGLAQGLAVKVPYDDMVQDMYRNQAYRQNQQQQAEQRAKMFADDTQFTNAMNAYDHDIVSNYARAKITDLGKWTSQNPNWRYDPNLRAQYQNMVNDIKDNYYLRTGLQVDAAIKDFQAFQKDPKNADVLDLPEMVQYRRQLENYLKSGSIDGNTANRLLFDFKPPFEGYNTTPDIIKYAQAAKKSGVNMKYLPDGGRSMVQFVSDADKQASVNAYLNDVIDGRKARYEYNHYIANLGEKDSKPTLQKYWLDKFEPHFKSPDYSTPHYDAAGKNGKGGNTGEGGNNGINPYDKLINDARNNPARQIPADNNGVRELLVGANNYANINNAFFMNNKGNLDPYHNAGSVPESRISTSDSKMYHNPVNGKYYISYDVLLTPKEANRALFGKRFNDEDEDAIILQANKNYNANLVEENHMISGKQYTDRYIQTKQWKEVDPDNAHIYNHGVKGTKAEVVNSEQKSANVLVSPDGTMYQDLDTGKFYDAKTNQEIK